MPRSRDRSRMMTRPLRHPISSTFLALVTWALIATGGNPAGQARAAEQGTITTGIAATTRNASPTTACTSGLKTNFNYELFVNGTFVARDAIAFTPFDSSVVRFKARYPITYAVKLVDWEGHIGVGLEYARLFEPARFIWSRSLKLDNLVLARHTVEAPPK